MNDVDAKTEQDLVTALIITLLILFLEIAGGLYSNSLSLLGDAGHIFSDLLALTVSFIAFRLALISAYGRRTFGFHRGEVLAALFNGGLLFFLAFMILFTAYQRMLAPQEIESGSMLAVAVIGLLGNIYVAMRLHKNENLNIRSVFYHVIGDALSSIGVIVSAVLIFLTGNTIVDALMSIAIAAIILFSSYTLLRNSLSILFESAPRWAHPDKITEKIRKIAGVKNVHDVHVWRICSNLIYATAHVVVENKRIDELEKLRTKIEAMLEKEFSIIHVTLQFETAYAACKREKICRMEH